MKKLSLKEIQSLIHIYDKLTIQKLIKQGDLPEPENFDGVLLFNKQYVLDKLGLKDLDEPFLTSKDAAEILNLNQAKLFYKCKEGKIPFYRISRATKLLFRRSDLNQGKCFCTYTAR